MLLKSSTVHNTAPATKNYPAQNVNSAEVEKPWKRWREEGEKAGQRQWCEQRHRGRNAQQVTWEQRLHLLCILNTSICAWWVSICWINEWTLAILESYPTSLAAKSSAQNKERSQPGWWFFSWFHLPCFFPQPESSEKEVCLSYPVTHPPQFTYLLTPSPLSILIKPDAWCHPAGFRKERCQPLTLTKQAGSRCWETVSIHFIDYRPFVTPSGSARPPSPQRVTRVEPQAQRVPPSSGGLLSKW